MKSTRTAFERQILESVTIQKERGNFLMNNKAEYNRCALPRLTAKLGEKELGKWREEDRAEMEREASIEEKIRIRKKQKAKDRAGTSRRMEPGQPAKKKRRVEADEGEEDNQETELEPTRKKIAGKSPEKRKGEQDRNPKPKKARPNHGATPQPRET